MPFEAHELCNPPENPEAKIWRFLSLPKFLEMLHSRSLYFCRADQFDDPYEGMMWDEYVDVLKQEESLISKKLYGLTEFEWRQRWVSIARAQFYVNSWHISEHESAAMWRLYSSIDAGVAICSTYERLVRAFRTTDERVFIGLIQYGGDILPRMMNGFEFITRKRQSFDYEREIRAMLWHSENTLGAIDVSEGGTGRPTINPSAPLWMKMTVDLPDLLTEVLVSPSAPVWFAPVVSDILSKYNKSISVRASDLFRLKYLET